MYRKLKSVMLHSKVAFLFWSGFCSYWLSTKNQELEALSHMDWQVTLIEWTVLNLMSSFMFSGDTKKSQGNYWLRALLVQTFGRTTQGVRVEKSPGLLENIKLSLTINYFQINNVIENIYLIKADFWNDSHLDTTLYECLIPHMCAAKWSELLRSRHGSYSCRQTNTPSFEWQQAV